MLLAGAGCDDGRSASEAPEAADGPMGVAWTDETPEYPDAAPFHIFAAWTDPATGGTWAVGAGRHVLTSEGSAGAWKFEDRPDAESVADEELATLLALDGAAGAELVVAAGERGRVLVRQGEAWRIEPVGTRSDLHAVLVQDDGSAYVAGREGALFLRPAGGGGWSEVDLRSVDHIYALARAGGGLWAVGSFGTALREVARDDGTLGWERTDTDTGRALSSVWSSPAGDLFAAGLQGAFLSWTGDAWVELDNPYSPYLRSLWGRGPSDLFAAGWDGAVIHWDGQRFCNLSPGGWRLEAIVGDAGGVRVFGVNGRIWSAPYTGPCPSEPVGEGEGEPVLPPVVAQGEGEGEDEPLPAGEGEGEGEGGLL